MEEVRVAEIRKKLNREEDDDIEFLLELLEQNLERVEKLEEELYLTDGGTHWTEELVSKKEELEDTVEELERKLEELRKTTVSINLGDYI